jgi:hypothetical protein
MPNPAVKPSIADGTAKGIRGRVGRRQNILQKGVFGKPKAPFLLSCRNFTGVKLRQKHVAGSGGEAIVGSVKQSSNVA